MREYFETSRRTCLRVWPDGPAVPAGLLPRFGALRPVIESGWEMPVLLRALALGMADERLARDWIAARTQVLAGDGSPREALIATLRATVDDVRREWITQDPLGWVRHHALYCPAGELRRVVAAPGRTVIVTTKEGEFARRLLDHWGVPVAGIQGKESGSHKCENLRELLGAARGTAPSLWFVEDRLETLRCVRRCAAARPELDAVRLFLAAWGYNTESARESARGDPHIVLLTLDRFRRGATAWLDA